MSPSTAQPVTIEVDDTHRVSGLLMMPPQARACFVLAHGERSWTQYTVHSTQSTVHGTQHTAHSTAAARSIGQHRQAPQKM